MVSGPRAAPIRFFGRPSSNEPLDWSWVEGQLVAAGTYWVVANTSAFPHPRPVWGIWHDRSLVLSIGSPTISQSVGGDPNVTVHLDSGTDVVLVEGVAQPVAESDDLIRQYDAKYEWTYTYEEFGPFTRIEPVRVLAWRSAGWAGRDGFRAAGSWRFAP